MPKKPVVSASATLRIERLRKQLAAARRTIAELRLRADTDALLDIPNRRGFERELRRSIAYVKRYRASAALIFLDVDRLKPINDRLGHAAGDAALKAVSEALTANVRLSDVVARLGGDEFGILLWNISAADALKKARALEGAIDQIDFSHRGRDVRIGASAGVTMLNGNDETVGAVQRADEAMYERKHRKRRGRGRTIKR